MWPVLALKCGVSVGFHVCELHSCLDVPFRVYGLIPNIISYFDSLLSPQLEISLAVVPL